MTIQNHKENKLIFEAYKDKVIKEAEEQWKPVDVIPLELPGRTMPHNMSKDQPGYFTTGEVTYEDHDDSDFNREHGHGQLIRSSVKDVEVLTVDYLDAEENVVDITDQLSPEEIEAAKDAILNAWEASK